DCLDLAGPRPQARQRLDPNAFRHAATRLAVFTPALSLPHPDGMSPVLTRATTVGCVIRWLVVSWAVYAVVVAIPGWVLSVVRFNGSAATVIWAALVFGILHT